MRFAPTDVAKIARSIAEALRNDSSTSEIHLLVDVPGEPVMMRADAVRIEQIVWNLVSNALKFMPSGGKVNVGLQREADKVRLEVADTGVGIAPHLLETIFDFSQQAPNVPSRARSSGLGIGLSLVRQLLQLHGGTVEAFSEGEGQRARFVVWQPADASFAHRQASEMPADLSIFKAAECSWSKTLKSR